MRNNRGWAPHGPKDTDTWMALRNAGRLGGPAVWAGGPNRPQSQEELIAEQERKRAEARRRMSRRDAEELRRTGRRALRELPPRPSDFNVLGDPADRLTAWDLPLPLSLKMHELLKIYAEEHDLGARTRDQSYLYAPKGWYNPYDDLPAHRDER